MSTPAVPGLPGVIAGGQFATEWPSSTAGYCSGIAPTILIEVVCNSLSLQESIPLNIDISKYRISTESPVLAAAIGAGLAVAVVIGAVAARQRLLLFLLVFIFLIIPPV